MRESLHKIGDALARRKGGAFDRTIVPETECLQCGKTYSKPITWHDQNGFKCPACGGNLDKRPLDILMRDIVARFRAILPPSP